MLGHIVLNVIERSVAFYAHGALKHARVPLEL